MPEQLTLRLNVTQSGVFFIGDPGFAVLDKQTWRDWFCSQAGCGDGIYKVNALEWFIAGTGGDGYFHGFYNEQGYPLTDLDDLQEQDMTYMPVDSGTLGVIPIELCTQDTYKLRKAGFLIDLFSGFDPEDLEEIRASTFNDGIEILYEENEYFMFDDYQILLRNLNFLYESQERITD